MEEGSTIQSKVIPGPIFSLASSGQEQGNTASMTTASGRIIRRPPGASYLTDEGKTAMPCNLNQEFYLFKYAMYLRS